MPSRRAETQVVHLKPIVPGSMVFNACISVKNIGKPCAGEPHARFDEGGLKHPYPVFHSSRVRQTDLKDAEFAVSSLLYPISPPIFQLAPGFYGRGE